MRTQTYNRSVNDQLITHNFSMQKEEAIGQFTVLHVTDKEYIGEETHTLPSRTGLHWAFE